MSPEVNLTVNTELLDAGVLAVNLRKSDSGSGVRTVDVYQVMPGSLYIIQGHKQGALYCTLVMSTNHYTEKQQLPQMVVHIYT